MSYLQPPSHILPISIEQPAPSSSIIRQQQETLQRLQEQNLKHQQQIDSFKNKYSSNIPNSINLGQFSPQNPNLLTASRSNIQQQSSYDQIRNNSIGSIRQQTPPSYRQLQSSSLPYNNLETGHFQTNHSNQNLTHQQNITGLNSSLFPLSYPNQTQGGVQSSIQSNPQYQSLQHRTIYKVPRNNQLELDQPISIVQQQPINEFRQVSPHSIKIEQTYTQQTPITQNPILENYPDIQTHLPFPVISQSQNINSILSGYSYDKPNFGIIKENQTLYAPIESIKRELVDPIPYSMHVNKFASQDKDVPLFPDSQTKGFQSSNRRQMNYSSYDLHKHDVNINKENDKDYKTYIRQNEKTLNKDEFSKIKELQLQNKIDDLEIQNQKLQNEIKMKNIEVDTHKSANEGYEKKAQKYENRIKELENIIETLKIEQEKILDVCEKKDVEIEEQNIQLADKQKEVNECQSKVQHMQEEFNNIQDKLQLYEDTQDELQSQMQKNAIMDQRNNYLNQEVKNMKQIILDLESQMKQLQGQLPPVPYKQMEQETVKMQQYIQNLEQRLLIVSHEKNEEVSHWRSIAEIDSARVFEQMENRVKFLATENERLNQIIVGRCVDMRQNW